MKLYLLPYCVNHLCQDLENIFSNILDIYQFTAKLLSSVEEQLEVAAENETPQVGICFQDLAEVRALSVTLASLACA